MTAEGPVSVFSLCLPSIFSLIKRAKQGGLSALFTTLDLDTQTSADIRSASRTGSTEYRTARGSRGLSNLIRSDFSSVHGLDLRDSVFLSADAHGRAREENLDPEKSLSLDTSSSDQSLRK